jgi:hypothetical protein
MYAEWYLESDPRIRLIISGYEDGSDSGFYKVDGDGDYRTILHFIPIIEDKNGDNWWGYAWDIQDLPVKISNHQIYVQATFVHDQMRDGSYRPPEWQKDFPVVRFIGERTRWNSKQPSYDFEWMALEELASQASVNKAKQEGTP